MELDRAPFPFADANPTSASSSGSRDTYHKTLLKACLVAGDETALARRLGATVSTTVDWLLGERRVPTDVFLKAVDIVLTARQESVKGDRALLEQIRRKHRRFVR